MSGRGSGRGNYNRGGRGFNRNNNRYGGRGNNRSNNSRNNNNNKQRRGLMDYIFTVGSPKQASEFNTISEYLINHIREKFTKGGDIASALEAGKDLDFTAMQNEIKLTQVRRARKLKES